MENQQMANREMNFFDLCVACARAVGRGCVALWHLFAHMLRLTYRYWWLVLTLVVVAVAGSWYYTRVENTIYKVNAVALLNGPTIQQFEQAYTPLRAGIPVEPDQPLNRYMTDREATCFTTFRVVDCFHDGIADMVDFKRKSSPTDTLKVQMHDRLCLQFRIKKRDFDKLPSIEQALLDYLNSDEAMQQSYAAYLPNLKNEVAFNHEQAQKLDSLTSAYYFNTPTQAQPMAYSGNGVNFYGDRRVRLFLNEIYQQHARLQRDDYRLQLASAPVVLENHFSADPKPVNGRGKCVALCLLLGWAAACALAELIDKRKAILAWLKA